MLEATIRRFRRDKRGISNVVVAVLSLILIVMIVGNVILWSYDMNQLDWEKMQERISLVDGQTGLTSPWFVAQNEFQTEAGTQTRGSFVQTQTADGNFESFEEGRAFTNTSYSPLAYSLIGSTRYVSGGINDLATNDGAYMVVRTNPSSFSAQDICAHAETTMISGSMYFSLRAYGADASGVPLAADASTVGRKLFSRQVYPLVGIASIPESVWSFYYRAYKTGPDTQVTAHCDVSLLIRKGDGTVRATISAEAANSLNLPRDAWTTVSASYSWANYTVVDQTDFLEIDYYAHVTSGQANRNVFLNIDDSNLPLSDQTRIANVTIPSQQKIQLEIVGSSNTVSWESLTWTFDSHFSTGDVNVVLQLFNYTADSYSQVGSGMISYVSNAVVGQDDTLSQTIAAGTSDFRNSTGYWKMQITATKSASLPFDLGADWIEYRAETAGNAELAFVNQFKVDPAKYPAGAIAAIQIQIAYRVNSTEEKWYLTAFNWSSSSYSSLGFNCSSGNQPVLDLWNEYDVNVTDSWRSYLRSDGTVRVRFNDEATSNNETLVEIDFFGVSTQVGGFSVKVRNSCPLTVHIIAVWVENTTLHQRFDADSYVNSADEATLALVNGELPEGNLSFRIVTERGNEAVSS